MTLKHELEARLAGTVVLMGIGNPLLGDDAAGCLVAGLLAGRRTGCVVLDCQDVPESFIGRAAAARPDTVVLVDAVELGGPPGSVALLEKEQVSRYIPTTHRVPLGFLMEVIAGECGSDVLLLAIQPGHMQLGRPASPEVEASAAILASLVDEIVSAGGDAGMALARRETV